MDIKQKAATSLEEAIKTEASLFWDRLEELKIENPEVYTEITKMMDDLRTELNNSNQN